MEPLRDPASIDAVERAKIINQIREEQAKGIEHSEDVLNWALKLIQISRQAATGRGGKSDKPPADRVVPYTVDELL